MYPKRLSQIMKKNEGIIPIVTMQANEGELPTLSAEETTNSEAVNDQNNEIITEAPKNANNQTTDNVATCSTPVQNIKKSDASHALTMPRAASRKPLINDIGLVTRKRAPRKVNVSVALATETPSTYIEKPQEEEKPESPITDVESKFIEQEDAIFAKPAKIPLTAKGNSAIKRSAKRKQENVGSKAMTPKSRKLNVSTVPETPCEAETSIVSEQNQTVIANDKQTDANFDLITIQSEWSEETNEPIQSNEEIAFLSIPAKVKLTTSLNGSSSSALTGSKIRKQTPRKLDISIATATPCKTETPKETSAQETVESMSVENESISTVHDEPSEGANVQVEAELSQIQNDIIVATSVKPINCTMSTFKIPKLKKSTASAYECDG